MRSSFRYHHMDRLYDGTTEPTFSQSENISHIMALETEDFIAHVRDQIQQYRDVERFV